MQTRLQAIEALPIFAQSAPSVAGSATSKAAAASIGTHLLTRLQSQVFEYIQARPAGATDEEIASGLGMNPSTSRPRRIELVRLRLVVADGTRRASSGRSATAWRVATNGR